MTHAHGESIFFLPSNKVFAYGPRLCFKFGVNDYVEEIEPNRESFGVHQLRGTQSTSGLRNRERLYSLSANSSTKSCRIHILAGSRLNLACQNRLMAMSGKRAGWGEVTSPNGVSQRCANRSGRVEMRSVD